jgi:hypothetical protein
MPTMAFTSAAPPLPSTLTLNGLMLNGRNRQAIISGVTFDEGETKKVPLLGRTLSASCIAIHNSEVILKVEGTANPVVLEIRQEKAAP